MGEWFGLGMVVGLCGLAAVFVAFKVRGDGKRDRALKELALSLPGAEVRDNGDPEETRISFPHRGHEVRLGFTVEGSRHRNRHASGTPQYFTDLLLVLGPSRIDVEISRENLLGKMARKLVAEDLQFDDPEFDERFLVYSDHPVPVSRFLTAQVREAIGGLAYLAPGDDLQITVVREGLRLRLRGRKHDPEHLGLFVELGLQVIDGYLDALELDDEADGRRCFARR